MQFYRLLLKTVAILSSLQGMYERNFGKYVRKSAINSCPLLLGGHINVENTNVENAKSTLTSKMPFCTNVENEQNVGFELSWTPTRTRNVIILNPNPNKLHLGNSKTPKMYFIFHFRR